MVSVGVSKLGITDLIFIDPEAKVNGAYYRDMLLSQQLLSMICDVSGEFIFQQDSAPAHWERDTVRLLELATPAFIPPDKWPPNSPDLNPVDYKIWSVVQQRVYQSLCTTLTNSSSIWCTFGTASTRPSLTMQLMSGMVIFMIVCGRRVDILNKCCDNIKRLIIQPCDNKRFVCVNIIRFTKYLSVILNKFEL